MNLLVDKLPKTIEIHGQEYQINSDFRACLSIILAFEDEELTDLEKQFVMIRNLYEDRPDDFQAAMDAGMEFLNGGAHGVQGSDGPRVYSFSKDANLIFAAFHQTHGIDLEAVEYLHWWKFMALFMDLGQNTTFCELVSLRKRVKTGKASKEEKAAARDLGDMFEIPEIDDRTLEEKEAERRFLEAIGGSNVTR